MVAHTQETQWLPSDLVYTLSIFLCLVPYLYPSGVSLCVEGGMGSHPVAPAGYLFCPLDLEPLPQRPFIAPGNVTWVRTAIDSTLEMMPKHREMGVLT